MKTSILKQTILLCTILLTAGTFFTNCSQEEFDMSETTDQDLIEISVCMPNQEASSRVSYDDTTLRLTWEKNDSLVLKGFDMANQYVGDTKFNLVNGEGSNVASFQGKPLANATYYVIYYKSPNKYNNNNIDYLEIYDTYQIQKENNSTEHLKDFLLLKSEKFYAKDLTKAKFSLNPQSCIMKFVIDNLPSNNHKIQRLRLQTGSNVSHYLHFEHPVETDKLICYLAFSPENMKLNAQEKFFIELFYTDGNCYYTETVSPNGKTYLPGGRSTAKINNDFIWKQIDTSNRILFKTFDGKPLSVRLESCIVTAEKNTEGYWIAVKENNYPEDMSQPIITTLPSFCDYDLNDSNLSSIIIPNTVTNITTDAFYCCTHLSTITIPNSVTYIGSGAFSGCSNLSSFKGKFATSDGRFLINKGEIIGFAPKGATSVSIPEGVTSLSDEAFLSCKELTSITLPSSLKAIPGYNFIDCENLSSINLDEGLQSIGECCFYNAAFKSVKIPQSVTSLGCGAFSNCKQLVKFEGKYASADGKFLIDNVNGKKKLLSGVVKGVSTLNIPEDIDIVGFDCFFGVQGITSIIIPKNVSQLEESAFASCPNLKEVKILSPKITMDIDTFYPEDSENAILYLNVKMKDEVIDGNVWYTTWKEIKFIDEKGNLVQ